jgi:hypothetical protein
VVDPGSARAALEEAQAILEGLKQGSLFSRRTNELLTVVEAKLALLRYGP